MSAIKAAKSNFTCKLQQMEAGDKRLKCNGFTKPMSDTAPASTTFQRIRERNKCITDASISHWSAGIRIKRDFAAGLITVNVSFVAKSGNHHWNHLEFHKFHLELFYLLLKNQNL